MKPSYTFEEMRDLIRKADCEKDVSAIAHMLRVEGKRYSVCEMTKLSTAFQKVKKIIER